MQLAKILLEKNDGNVIGLYYRPSCIDYKWANRDNQKRGIKFAICLISSVQYMSDKWANVM